MNTAITLQRAASTDKASVVALLQSLDLPTEDLPQSLDHFIIAQELGKVVGSVGLEVFDSYALLRSLAVTPQIQGSGLGKSLYHAAISLAKEQSVSEVYLITTTAAPFFEKQGFKKVERASVPVAIQGTAQFSSVCPSSATIMHRKTD